MAKKKDSSPMSTNKSSDTSEVETPTQEPKVEALVTEALASESPMLENPLVGKPVEPPAKRKGRPPGSKNSPKKSPQPQNPEVMLPREMLVATAMLYSTALQIADLTPHLNSAETEAIVEALDAVAKQYAHLLKHAPLVVLAATMALPIIPRVQAKRERAEQGKGLAPAPAPNVEPKASAA
jgi:hypothetical protein